MAGPDDDAMDLDDPRFGAAAAAEAADDPLDGLYDDPVDAAAPEDGAALAAAPLPRDWDTALRQRVPKRRRPQEWASPAAFGPEQLGEEEEPVAKAARHGDVSQVDLDEANRPFQAAFLQELHFRAHHADASQEERNWALAELAKLQRDLCYYKFRMGERVAENSAHVHPLLGEPLLVDIMAYPNWKPDESEPRKPLAEETGVFRRISMYPAITVDLIDTGFITAIGEKRRLTVHLPNMEWADDVRVLAEKFGAHNVAEAFEAGDGGIRTDLVHFLKWLVGQTCYLSLRTSRHCYWYHQEFKFVTGKCNPFGGAHAEYLKYIYQQHACDDEFRQRRPREHETLVETWTAAMQTLETCDVVGMDAERKPICADTNFPRVDWMPLPVKQLLARLTRHSDIHFWHPSWNALDYCLLLGEWYLTTA
jgi:hypothetical protein